MRAPAAATADAPSTVARAAQKENNTMLNKWIPRWGAAALAGLALAAGGA